MPQSASPINWPRFADIVRTHQRFLLTSHMRPDCDALGSELGMAGILTALGKQVRIVNGQATPPNLAFIDPQKQIRALGEDVRPEDLRDVEVLMVLDTSAWAQLGPMAEVVRASQAKKLILDHHVGQDDLGAELFKDTSAEATGRLVVDAAEQLGVNLTPQMAMPLYAALATDTGWFRFNSTNPGTYRTAARLLEAGAVPQDIYRDLYEQDTLGRVKLRGRILERAEVELDGRLAATYVLKQDFAETGALPSDTEDVINMTLAIAGVQAAVIMIEQMSGGFKLSFRSRCALDCNQLARQFGGGGHKAAAGAFLQGSFDEVRPRVLDAMRAAMS
jgi:bifunctional oligoribonuclease and PAP phosphatase NrnA